LSTERKEGGRKKGEWEKGRKREKKEGGGEGEK